MDLKLPPEASRIWKHGGLQWYLFSSSFFVHVSSLFWKAHALLALPEKVILIKWKWQKLWQHGIINDAVWREKKQQVISFVSDGNNSTLYGCSWGGLKGRKWKLYSNRGWWILFFHFKIVLILYCFLETRKELTHVPDSLGCLQEVSQVPPGPGEVRVPKVHIPCSLCNWWVVYFLISLSNSFSI